MTHIDIVFDRPPAHESGRFIEVEDHTGASIRAGEWTHRDDGHWALRIPTTGTGRDVRAVSRAHEPTAEEYREEVRGAIGSVLSRVTNFPTRVQRSILGRDMWPVIEKAADAVIAAGYRRTPASPATVEAAARLLHAWDVADGPCDGPWDDLTDEQRDLWLSAAQTLADAGMLAGVVTDAMVERAVARTQYLLTWTPVPGTFRANHADTLPRLIRAAMVAAHGGDA